jgi:hypothetical protein
LLKLIAIGHRLRNLVADDIQLDAVFAELAFHQGDGVFDNLVDVGRFESVAPVFCHRQDTGRDFGGSVSGSGNFFEAIVAGLLVLMPQPHPGVVDHGHQYVVELVGRGSYQLAHRRQFLSLKQSELQLLNLLP